MHVRAFERYIPSKVCFENENIVLYILYGSCRDILNQNVLRANNKGTDHTDSKA